MTTLDTVLTLIFTSSALVAFLLDVLGFVKDKNVEKND